MIVRSCLAVVVSLLWGVSLFAQVKYFPPGEMSDTVQLDKFVSDWYSKQLTALGEPSLWGQSKIQKNEAYRFLWLRTFDHPLAIRIEIQADGTSTITTKIASGAGGYDPGKLIKNDSFPLDKKQTDLFLHTITEKNFWELPSHEKTMGCDGAQWVIEGIKNGTYHFVDRWSPKDGDVRAIGLLMLKDLAGLRISSKEIY